MSDRKFVINAEEIYQTILERVDGGYWDEDTTIAMEEFTYDDAAMGEINEIIERFDFERVLQAIEQCESDIIAEIKYNLQS